MFPIDVSSCTRFHDSSVDTVSAAVSGTWVAVVPVVVAVMMPVFDPVFTVLSGC
jgi:hypothetical protein